ncbi:hypothetical protein LguiB_019321 [Lonicera macranthoides]
MGNLSSFFIILLLLISLSSQSAAKLRSSKLTPRLSGKKFSHLDKPSKILNLQQYKYETQYFDQRLDHFSFAEFPNFRRKHLISFDHWNGPAKRAHFLSMPYGSKDEAYKNSTTLAHLTIEQALADFAVLLTDLKRNLSAEACPVVLLGGSYGGDKMLTFANL